MFGLTIWSYLLLCLYVAGTWWVMSRWRGDPRYRRTGFVIWTLLALGTLWMAWALVYPRHHANATGDYTWESVGCLLACLTGLYGLVWTVRTRALAGLMTVIGGGWLFVLYIGLIASN